MTNLLSETPVNLHSGNRFVDLVIEKSAIKNKQAYHVPFNDRNIKQIQGANSKTIKYSPSMCDQCNNARSSEWDKDYDLFADYCFNYYKANEC